MLDLIGQWRLALVDLRYEAGRAQVVVLRADGEPAIGRADEDPTGNSLERCRHGDALGGLRVSGHGKEFSEDSRLPGPVDVESDPERIEAATRQAVAQVLADEHETLLGRLLAWQQEVYGLEDVFRPERVSMTLDTIKRTCVAATKLGTVLYATAEGVPAQGGSEHINDDRNRRSETFNSLWDTLWRLVPGTE